MGLNLDDAIWDVAVFTKNRERWMAGEVSERLLLAVVEQAHAKRLLSEEHFTVYGTLIQAWANRRSLKEKKDPPDRGTLFPQPVKQYPQSKQPLSDTLVDLNTNLSGFGNGDAVDMAGLSNPRF